MRLWLSHTRRLSAKILQFESLVSSHTTIKSRHILQRHTGGKGTVKRMWLLNLLGRFWFPVTTATKFRQVVIYLTGNLLFSNNWNPGSGCLFSTDNVYAQPFFHSINTSLHHQPLHLHWQQFQALFVILASSMCSHIHSITLEVWSAVCQILNLAPEVDRCLRQIAEKGTPGIPAFLRKGKPS